MKIKKTVGVIGVGRMGESILSGLLAQKIADPKKITVFDRDKSKAKDFCRKNKTKLAVSSHDLVKRSQVILLAMKPQDFREAADEWKSSLGTSHQVISILAGTPIAKLRSLLGKKPALVRAMPNLGAQVGASITALTGSNAAALKVAEQIFSGCGKTVRLPESQFDLVTALSGSGPAYYFLLTELLAESAVKLGLSRTAAVTLAVETALGSGLLASRSGIDPAELRQRVTSKGGTTAAALSVFESGKLKDLVAAALKAARDRGRELAAS